MDALQLREEADQALLDYVCANTYLHTSSATGLIHEACLRLEQQGLLRRHIDEPDHVCWVLPPPPGPPPLAAGWWRCRCGWANRARRDNCESCLLPLDASC